jgi:hypothetical protein
MRLTDPRLPSGTDVGRLVVSLYDFLRRVVMSVNALDDARVLTGVGSPEGVVTASVGQLYTDTAGGAGTTLYVKESGVNTKTGWAAK